MSEVRTAEMAAIYASRIMEQDREIERLLRERDEARAEAEGWKALAEQRAADWVLLRRQYEELENDRY